MRVLGLLGAIGALLCMTPRDARAQDVQAVPGPSNLQATAVSSSRIDLKWTKVTTSLVVEYRIYYANGTRVATVPASESSYSDTGLLPWTEYRYYITGASSSGNESGPSSVATARTLDGTPPTVPGNFEGTALSATQISLSWSAANDPQSGIDEYVVYRGGSEITRTSSLTYQDNGLTPDQQYSYRVSAINGQGDEGAKAGPIAVRTLAEPPPDPPRDLTAEAFSASAIDLDWRAPADDADVASYRIYRGGTRVGTATGTSYRDTGLASYTVYEYRVTSVNGSGDEGNPSNAASARTLDGSPPTAPGNFKGTALSSTQISLTWSAASDAQTGISEYVMYRGGSEIGRTASLAYQDNGRTPDQQYSYQVSAINGQGAEGAKAGPIAVRTLAEPPPDPPRDLTAEAFSASAIDLSWRAPADDADVASYRIYRGGTGVGTSTGTSYRDTGLASFTVYEYRVTSVNGAGDESTLSNAASARTLDGSPPTAPGNFKGTALSSTQISLTWSAASDAQTGIAEYVVYRGGSEIGRTASLAYQDNGRTPDQQYSYQVSAINGQGNEGAKAGPIPVRTLAEPPPDSPRDLTAEAFSASAIDLSWRAPADDADVASYRIYRGGTQVGTSTGTSYRDTGLASYTVYEYRVTSVNGSGDEGNPSNAASARTLDGTPPTPPGGLNGTALGQTQIALSWSEASDPQTGIAEYVVYRDGGEISRTVALSYADGSLRADQVYEYEVSAVNGQGDEGNRTGPIEVRTLSDVAPDPPTGLAALAVDESTVDLTWDTHPDDDLDGYRVYRDGLFVAGIGGTSYRDTGLAPFTTYVYTVTAVAEDGDESAPSETAAVTTPDATPPSVPQGVAASAVGGERIDVSWSPSTDDESGVAGYRVFRDGGEIALTSSNTYQDGGLAPGTTYEYQVSAINGAGVESERSSPAYATTPDDSGPTVPANLSATAISTESIGLSWSPSTDDESGITNYRVFRGGEEIATPTGAEYQDTGLTSGTTYEYRVSAVNGDGLESDLSAVASATTLTDEGPPAPTGLTATPLDASQIRLAWTAPEGGAAGYNVFRDQVFIGNVMATAFVDTGLEPATTYLYSVASVDSDGIQGSMSGQISATTSPTVDLVPPAAPTGLRLITP